MAGDSNALRMTDAALLSKSAQVKAVVNDLFLSGSILTDIPFVNEATLKKNGLRQDGDLPTVNWGPSNAAGAVGRSSVVPFEEQAYIIRNLVQTDSVYMRQNGNVVEPHAFNVASTIKAIAYD